MALRAEVLPPAGVEEAPLARRVVWIDRAALAIQVVALAYALVLTAAPPRFFARILEDDASYYFQIARNAAAGFGFTFDRLNPTDGFQPLWEWILTAILRLHPLTTVDIVRLGWCLQSVFFAGAVWLLWNVLREAVGSGAAALGMALLLRTAWSIGHSGMESALLFFAAAALLSVVGSAMRAEGGWRYATGIGVALAALLLSRVDSIFWAGGFVLALAVWWAGHEVDRRKTVIIAFGVSSLLFGSYLLWNHFQFGHWMPIGGGLKSSFPHPAWQVRRFSMWGRDLDLFYQCTVLAAAYLLARLTPLARRWPSFFRVEGSAASAGILAHNVFSALFMKWNVFNWHFALGHFYLAMLVPALLALALQRLAPRTSTVVWTLLLAVLTFGTAKQVLRRDLREPKRVGWTLVSWEAAQWVDSHLPAGAVLAMKDAGNMGFYSGRRVVDVDGVANSWAFQEALRAGRFAEFLERENVRYYAQHAFWDSDPKVGDGEYETFTFTAYSHLYDCAGGSIDFPRANEIYRSAPYYDGPYRTALVIWRIPEP